jgi:hypothetical protein
MEEGDRAVRCTTGERDICTDLGVWIVSGLETEVFNAHLFEEYTHETCVPTS